MSQNNFRNGLTEVPRENGRYQWKSFMGYIPVDFIDGEWFYVSGEKIPENLVRRWR